MIKEHYNHWFPKLINARGVTIYNHIFYNLPGRAGLHQAKKARNGACQAIQKRWFF